MLHFEAILFDLDGVVIDSEPLHEEATRVVFERYGLEVSESLFQQYKGKTDRDVALHVVRSYQAGGLDVDEIVREKIAVFRSFIGRLPLVPGADRFVRAAAARFRIGLTTSSVPETQRLAFERFGLVPYFQAVVTAADIRRPKPDPEPYRLTAERLGTDPANCLVIEDSVNGVLSGVGAGCTVAGLTTSFPPEALERAGAHLVVSSYPELAAYLGLSLELNEAA